MVVVMRLALRVLFGAINNQINEGYTHSEQIERQIKNNDRSGVFLRKLREVVGNPKLKAPEIFADESFPDANIVAEYLDGQSKSKGVFIEYERACIESPEMLAEVGCCYDILMNRLVEPIIAPKNCKRKLYYISWEEMRSSDFNGAIIETRPCDLNNEKHAVNQEEKQSCFSTSRNVENVCTHTTREKICYESDFQKVMRTSKNLRKKLIHWGIMGVGGGIIAMVAFVCVLGNWRNNEESDPFRNNCNTGRETGFLDGVDFEKNNGEQTLNANYGVESYAAEVFDNVSKSSYGFDVPDVLEDDVEERDITIDSVFVASIDQDKILNGSFREFENSNSFLNEDYTQYVNKGREGKQGKISQKNGNLHTENYDFGDLVPHEEIRIPEKNNDVFTKRF